MPTKDIHKNLFNKYSEVYEKMSMAYPDWLFGRLMASNWSWSSAMGFVRRKTGVEVDFRAFYAKFNGDKKACAHALWEKYQSERKGIQAKV